MVSTGESIPEDIRVGFEEKLYRAKAALPTLSAGLTARDNILDGLQRKTNQTMDELRDKTERREW